MQHSKRLEQVAELIWLNAKMSQQSSGLCGHLSARRERECLIVDWFWWENSMRKLLWTPIAFLTERKTTINMSFILELKEQSVIEVSHESDVWPLIATEGTERHS